MKDTGVMEIFWVVGEASGDRHAAKLMHAIGKVRPDWKHAGMAGDLMKGAGCEAVADISEASVMGLVEVVRHIPRMLKLRNRLLDSIRSRNSDLVILVDFPDFNLELLKKLRREMGRQVRVLYFISPQVWAWRQGRASMMAKQLDAMAVLFPFEVEFYKKYGLEAVYFGHPLAGDVAPSADEATIRDRLDLEEGREAIAIMPGSRDHEVERHLDTQLKAVEVVRRTYPDIVAVVVKAPTIEMATLQRLSGSEKWVRVVDESAYDVMSVSRVGLVKSGTSTVESAFIGTPFVVLYKVSGLTFFIAKSLVRGVKHVAMVNVLGGREIVPELLQNDATPENLAREVLRLWEGPDREVVVEGLREVAESLGEPGAMDRLAEWVVQRFE